MPRKPAAPPQNVEAQESPELAQGTLLQTSEGADSDTSLSPDQPRWVVEDLDPPYTSPAPVIPVEGAAYGVGIRHLEEGLTYAFERWDEINVGDSYRIYMEKLNGLVAGGSAHPHPSACLSRTPDQGGPMSGPLRCGIQS